MRRGVVEDLARFGQIAGVDDVRGLSALELRADARTQRRDLDTVGQSRCRGLCDLERVNSLALRETAAGNKLSVKNMSSEEIANVARRLRQRIGCLTHREPRIGRSRRRQRGRAKNRPLVDNVDRTRGRARRGRGSHGDRHFDRLVERARGDRHGRLGRLIRSANHRAGLVNGGGVKPRHHHSALKILQRKGGERRKTRTSFFHEIVLQDI